MNPNEVKKPGVAGALEAVGKLLKFPEKPSDTQKAVNAVKERNIKKREQKAEQLKKEREAKHPRPDGEPKSKVEVIQEKYQEELVKQGVRLNVEEKLQIIQREASDPKATALSQTCDALKQEFSKKQEPASRTRIESIIKSIPDTVYADKDLADIAREIKQQAYNHIMRNPAYMSGIDIKQRAAMGTLFKDAKATRVYGDEEYLRLVGEQVPYLPEVTKTDIEAEKQVAVDLVKRLNETKNLDDVDAIIKTVRSPQMVDKETALRKIDHGPDWVKKAKDSALDNPYALSMLADVSDAYVVNPDLLKDAAHLEPAYVYMKGVQLRIENEQRYGPGENFDFKTLNGAEGTRDAMVSQVKMATEGKQLFKDTDYSFYMSVSQEAVKEAHGAAPAPSAGSDFNFDASLETKPLDPVADAALLKELAAWNFEINGQILGAYDRELVNFWQRLHKDYRQQLVDNKLDNFRSRLLGRLNEMYEENSERFSTMFFEWEDQKNVFANIELYLQNLKDEYDRNAMLWPNSFQDASMQSAARMKQFLNDRKFREKMQAYYQNEKNWVNINKYNEYQIDAAHPYTEHPLYKKTLTDKEWQKYYKEIVENFSMADIFQQIVVSFRSQEMEKVANSISAIAEHGGFVLRQGRGGFNEPVYEILKRKGFWRGPFDEQGRLRFMNGTALLEIKDKARAELLSPAVKAMHEPILKQKFGAAYSYEEAVDRAIDEMSSLHLIEFQRIRWGQRGLRLYLGSEQNDVLNTSFAAVGPEEAAMQAMMPIEEMLLKWRSADDVTMWQIEEQTIMDSNRSGSGEFYKKLIEDTYSIPDKHKRDEEILKLKKFVFCIVQQDGPKDSMDHEWYKNVESRNLKFFFKRDHETGELLATAPTTLEEVTKEQLLRAATFRITLETMTDREMLGTYDIIDVSWIRKVKLNIYDKKYRTATSKHYREVALHERACHEVNDLFDFDKEDHDLLHHQTAHLVHIDEHDPRHEGILVTMNKCSPVYSVDALKAGGYMAADDMFDANIAAFNIYTEDVSSKWNAFADQFLMHEELINGAYALRPDLEANDIFRLNYAKFNATHATLGYTQVEYDLMKNIFKQLHPEIADPAQLEAAALRDMTNHLNAGNIMTKWLLKKEQLQAIKEPIIGTYFQTIHQNDARDITLDDENKKFSLSISRDDMAYNQGAGRVRSFKDLWNVTKMIVPDVIPLFRVEPDEKMWEEHRHRLFYTAEMTGGHFTNVKGLLYSTASFNKLTQIDFVREMLGQKGEHPVYASSIHQRIANTGGFARSTAQVEEQMHKASVLAGGRIEQFFPHLAHEVELQAHILFGRIKWPAPIRSIGDGLARRLHWKGLSEFMKKPVLDVSEMRWPKAFRKFGRWIYVKSGGRIEWPVKFFNKRFTLKTAWVPRVWALALLGGMGLALGMIDNAKKGFSGQSSGGGGGGHEEH
jgi:hypothetical protein